MVIAMIIDDIMGLYIDGFFKEKGYGYLFLISIFILFFPLVALQIRRLHDSNKSG
jgi:uncharacterized membrane protein YhaH (DUF805 family)